MDFSYKINMREFFLKARTNDQMDIKKGLTNPILDHVE